MASGRGYSESLMALADFLSKDIIGCVRITRKNRDFPYGKITIFPGIANTPNVETWVICLILQGLSLAPMLEVALNEVDAFCSRHGLVIAGYYQANEHFER